MSHAMDESTVCTVLRAATWAAEKHRHDSREDGSGFIEHGLGSARVVAEAGHVDAETLSAALCHDVVEHGGATVDDMSLIFGPTVSSGVDVLTVREGRDAFFALARASALPKVVKLGDLVHNLRSLLVARPATWGDERLRHFLRDARLYRLVAGPADPHLAGLVDEQIRSVRLRFRL